MNAPISAVVLQEQTSIANRAMKFKLNRGGTRRRVRDTNAEAQLEQATGDDGWLATRPIFKDKGSLVYKYQSVSGDMYSYHIKATLPFDDSSARLLPNVMYFEYTQEMGNYISQLDLLKTQIILQWDQLVQADINYRNAEKAAKGKPQDAYVSDYPTAMQMDASLYVNWVPEAISTSNDFRFALPQDMLDRVDAQLADMVASAGRDLYVRMLKPVTAFIEKLNDYGDGQGKRWYDSFVDNLNALSAEIPKLNITDDPVITELLGHIDAIVKPYAFCPEALKDNDFARASVKSKLEALESQLKGYAF